MTKTKEEVKTNHRSPFYAMMLPELTKVALDHGYALAIHGSMMSDLDMIAVPWIQNADAVEVLANAMYERVGRTIWQDDQNMQPTYFPHGRVTYAICIMGDVYIDLSIITPINNG